MSKALIVGGANGIGLSIAHTLAADVKYTEIYIVDRAAVSAENNHPKFKSILFDLEESNYDVFNQFADIDTLIITAGFGRLNLFENIEEQHIISSFNVNTVAPIRIIRHFYERLLHDADFKCAVMVSIAGYMSSPFFSIYAATKAALRIFIESVNVELGKSGSANRILNVSPGSIKGTSFNAGKTDLTLTSALAKEIVEHLNDKDDLFIPQYDEIFKEVLERYHADFREEGRHSYDYKIKSGRIK